MDVLAKVFIITLIAAAIGAVIGLIAERTMMGIVHGAGIGAAFALQLLLYLMVFGITIYSAMFLFRWVFG